VHGRDNNGNETSVIEMLQTLSNLIDQQDDNDPDDEHHSASPSSKKKQSSTRQARTSELKSASQGGLQRAPTTDSAAASAAKRLHRELVGPPQEPALQVFIEQLYGRCQLLERERLEMMEVTLDLLESSRRASKAEVDAALATARRKTAEDFMRMRRQNNMDRETLYHKLCSRCTEELNRSAARHEEKNHK